MGIFNRIGRLARAEVSELKRVLREGRSDVDELGPGAADELERERLIAEAEAELARADGDTLADEIEAGAELWGPPTPETQEEVQRGAEMWGGAQNSGAGASPPGMANRPPGRTHAFPREVREAYATLELPLGAERAAIEASFRALTQRYHPDRHNQAPHLLRAATELTIRIRQARDLLLAWLGGP